MEKSDHILDLIPEYILNCLDETETLRVYEHLANCSVCREEVRLSLIHIWVEYRE